jgi:hypothetical protein
VSTRVMRAPGALTAWSPRAGRQGVPWEHQWGPGVASGKAVGGGAHPNGVEAVEKPRDSAVHRQGESSGGRRRWRHSLVVSVRKREGEGDLNWGH